MLVIHPHQFLDGINSFAANSRNYIFYDKIYDLHFE